MLTIILKVALLIAGAAALRGHVATSAVSFACALGIVYITPSALPPERPRAKFTFARLLTVVDRDFVMLSALQATVGLMVVITTLLWAENPDSIKDSGIPVLMVMWVVDAVSIYLWERRWREIVVTYHGVYAPDDRKARPTTPYR